MATINRPIPQMGGMTESIIMGEIEGISVAGADISALDYLGEPNEMNSIFGTKDTTLCDEMEELRPSNLRNLQATVRKAERNGSAQDLEDAERALSRTGFKYWCAFGTNDLAFNHYHQLFLDAHNLHDFPYR